MLSESDVSKEREPEEVFVVRIDNVVEERKSRLREGKLAAVMVVVIRLDLVCVAGLIFVDFVVARSGEGSTNLREPSSGWREKRRGVLRP